MKIKIPRLIVVLVSIYVFAAAAPLVTPAAAAGTSTRETAKKSPPKKSKKWKLALNGGLTINTGNTESQVYHGGGKFELTLNSFSYKTRFEAFYGSSKGESIEDKGKWVNTFSLKLAKRLNAYAKTTMEYDIFADLELQTTVGLGIQYVLAKSAKTKAKIGGTINGEFTDAFAVAENIQNLGFGLDVSLDHKFSKTAKFSVDASFSSNFREFLYDFKVDFSASVTVLMVKPLWIKIKIKDKYVHKPLSEELEQNDFTLVTGLEVAF